MQLRQAERSLNVVIRHSRYSFWHIGVLSHASDRQKRSMKRYETRPKSEMKPPSVAQTTLKSVNASVGIAVFI